MVHVQRREDALLQDLCHRHMGELLDQQSQQNVIRVGVVYVLSWGEVGRVLKGNGEQVPGIPHLVGMRDERLNEGLITRVVKEPTGHIEHLTNRDGGSVGHLGKIPADRVIEP